jgi:dipeptidyl-peptidase-4
MQEQDVQRLHLVHPRLATVACAVVAAWLATAAVDAQQAQRGRRPDRAAAVHAQIDRIFTERAYDVPRFGPARWLPGGRAYTTLERTPSGGSEIARYDAATGARSVMVAASRLTPRGRSTPLDVDDYQWSADGRKLLVFTNTVRVWRQNTRGDYWVLDFTRDALARNGRSPLLRLGGGAPDSSLMFAKFSPDGTSVAYVRANDIYVERIDDARIVQLTRDGSGTTINGTSDWVNEEELDIRDGFRWSPDGRRIAYWQFETTGVGIFTLIDDTSSLYPVVTRFPYPKAGTTNSAVRIGVVSVDGGDTRWMKTPEDPRETYLASLDWVDDDTIAMQQLNRLQNRNDFLLGNAATGEVRRVFRDESKTWVDVQSAIPWIDDGRAFLWLSERDGWRHVYRVPRGGGDPLLVTRFDADVVDTAGVAGSQIYFVASPASATERYLFRAPLDGSAAPVRVTPAGATGTHTYTLAPADAEDGRCLAFHTYSRFDRVPVVDLVELPAHRPLRALMDPSALQAKLALVFKPPVEFFTVEVDGVSIGGYMLKPRSFTPSRKYPVIVHVYGEPASQTVLDRWGSRTMLFHRAMADAGYLVVSFDTRGTPAPKGAAWRKVIYGSVGELSSKEQAGAIRALAARRAFIDRARIGIWGWSGGGTNTLNAMFRFPDVYKVGVAVAPVPDQRLYDTIYQERYMGLPQENVSGYRRGSAIDFAEGLKGRLLIVHGSGDDNVHYQGTERLVNRLVELGKPFDLMVYPNRTHVIAEGPGTLAHVYHLIARYFLDNL